LTNKVLIQLVAIVVIVIGFTYLHTAVERS